MLAVWLQGAWLLIVMCPTNMVLSWCVGIYSVSMVSCADSVMGDAQTTIVRGLIVS